MIAGSSNVTIWRSRFPSPEFHVPGYRRPPDLVALEFPDGNIVLLTRLCEGQKATVLTLPTQPKPAAETEVQHRVAYG